jgi:hypothetical protein
MGPSSEHEHVCVLHTPADDLARQRLGALSSVRSSSRELNWHRQLK